MNTLDRKGITLAYQEAGSGMPPVLLVHGFGCDHTFLLPQLRFLGDRRRTIAVDLRGHGASDAPKQDYTMAGFADDLAWISAQLNLERPIVVGHSMGGNIALELAARYPGLPAAVVLIDSIILPAETFSKSLRPLAEELKGPNYLVALQLAAPLLFLPTDSAEFRSEVLASIAKTPQHVLASSFPNHVTDYDASAAIEASRVPIAYIGAASPMADVNRFRQLRPDLIVGQTIGSGHFSPRLVPDQINAMLKRFIEIYNEHESNNQ